MSVGVGEADLPELTPQELCILTLMAEGLGNAAIGQVLWVSTYAVEIDVKNLLARPGACDRTQAVAWAMRKALIA